MNETERSKAVLSLTALWGFSEAGLGGILHAVRMPFSATVIGAIAIVLLRMIAYFSDNNYRSILGATAAVLLIKATASPHTPPPAYIAVLCQGFFAAVFYAAIPSKKFASVLFGATALAESALQKLLMLTLVFGNNIWHAIDKVGKEVAGNFTAKPDARYALWISIAYVTLYALWGGLVGLFAFTLPEKMIRRREEVLKHYASLRSMQITTDPTARRNKRLKRILLFAGVLVFIISVLLLTGGSSKALVNVLLRTAAGVLILLFIIQPLLMLAIKKWLGKRTSQQRQTGKDAIAMLPAMRNYVPIAYRIAKPESSKLRAAQTFILSMIILALYAEKEPEN